MMFDRRITLALLFAMFLETAGGLIWAGQATERLAQVERASMAQGAMLERMARLEEQVVDMRASLRRIESTVDGLRRRG